MPGEGTLTKQQQTKNNNLKENKCNLDCFSLYSLQYKIQVQLKFQILVTSLKSASFPRSLALGFSLSSGNGLLPAGSLTLYSHIASFQNLQSRLLNLLLFV